MDNALSAYSIGKTHHGVLNGHPKHSCTNCGFEDSSLVKTYVSRSGIIKRLMECRQCGTKHYVSNVDYLKIYDETI